MNFDYRKIIEHPRYKQLSDPRNIGLYIFGFMTLLITWSGVNTIQTNFELQKKIAALQQQNDVKKLENGNMKLKNQYLATDQFLELATRREFGKAAPGERVYVVPKVVALSYVTKNNITSITHVATKKTKTQQNLDDWKTFLTGHQHPAN